MIYDFDVSNVDCAVTVTKSFFFDTFVFDYSL